MDDLQVCASYAGDVWCEVRARRGGRLIQSFRQGKAATPKQAKRNTLIRQERR
jgi:hypothetical protein